jgi:ADP-heptose:LPS heptosyltransferase
MWHKKTYYLFGFISIFEIKKVNSNMDKHPNRLNIAFKNGGGLGDCLIDIAFLKNLSLKMPSNINIDYFSNHSKIFDNFPFLRNSQPYASINNDDYDLVLTGHRYFIVSKINKDKVKKYSQMLYDFCVDCEQTHNLFNADNRRYIEYAKLFNKNRCEQLDLKQITGFDRKSPPVFCLNGNVFDIFDKTGVAPYQYITFNRGVGGNETETSPKLWPAEYYKRLILLLKNKYPDIKLIQLGATAKFGEFGADMNLIGKTSLQETAALLKFSLLHIDAEGGLVHLNRSVFGKSCVIFGPTPLDSLHYQQNINLMGNACPSYCDWVNKDWSHKCLRGFDIAPCMADVKPETVFNAAADYIDNMPQFEYKVRPISKLPKTKSFYNAPVGIEIYNIPLENLSCDFVSCLTDGEITNDKFAVLELLRVLAAGGTLVLNSAFLSAGALDILERLSGKKVSHNSKFLSVKKELI